MWDLVASSGESAYCNQTNAPYLNLPIVCFLPLKLVYASGRVNVECALVVKEQHTLFIVPYLAVDTKQKFEQKNRINR